MKMRTKSDTVEIAKNEQNYKNCAYTIRRSIDIYRSVDLPWHLSLWLLATKQQKNVV